MIREPVIDAINGRANNRGNKTVCGIATACGHPERSDGSQ